jgi:hypothetical protein
MSDGIEWEACLMFLPEGMTFAFGVGLGKHFSVVGNLRRGKKGINA